VSVYYQERRNFIRFDLARGSLSIQVTPTTPIPGEEAGQQEARNISRSGLLFASDVPFAIGVEVVILCEDERHGARMTLPARVVRVEETGEGSGRYEVGAAFLVEWEHQESEITEFLRRAGAAA
jgi:hypothetical protein